MSFNAQTRGWLVKLAAATSLCLCAAAAQAQQAAPAKDIPANPMKNAYFGELHVHTSYSLDSYVWGNSNDPVAAYKFARGGESTLADGQKVKLNTPLDFVSVTDHAETLGDVELCLDPKSEVYPSPACQKIRARDISVEAFSSTPGMQRLRVSITTTPSAGRPSVWKRADIAFRVAISSVTSPSSSRSTAWGISSNGVGLVRR